MRRRGGSVARALAGAVVLVLALSGCSGFFGTADEAGDGPDDEQTFVEPDFGSDTVTVNINLTDEGPEPETVFLPAGRHIRLVFRAHGRTEHHYRVAGLIPAEMSWMMVPEITEYDLETMSEEDLESLGLGGDIDDAEHVLHHLTPVFVPFREESPAGIKPLATEVHAYVTPGYTDVLEFFPTNTGTFVAEDVLNPELTGKVVVFDPAEVGAASD